MLSERNVIADRTRCRACLGHESVHTTAVIEQALACGPKVHVAHLLHVGHHLRSASRRGSENVVTEERACIPNGAKVLPDVSRAGLRSGLDDDTGVVSEPANTQETDMR